MKFGKLVIAAIVVIGLTGTALAQTPLNLETVSAADLNFEIEEKHSEEFHKYFYFHRSGVSFEAAKAEIGECYEYRNGPAGMEGQFINIVPTFVSLSEKQVNVPYVQNEAGLVGMVIGDIVSASLVLKNQGQRMRKCMEYKGYDRYGLSKDLWKQITNIDAATYIDVHARIASGPAPSAEKILP